MSVSSDSYKFQITMKKNLFDELQKYADNLGISRSAAINVCVSQCLQQAQTIQTMTDLMQEFKIQQEQANFSSNVQKTGQDE